MLINWSCYLLIILIFKTNMMLMTILILVMTTLTFEMLKASKNAEKLDDNAKNAKKLIDEGNAIMRRINKDFQNNNLFL
jgi:hypothetical protein